MYGAGQFIRASVTSIHYAWEPNSENTLETSSISKFHFLLSISNSIERPLSTFPIITV